jgi:hypothetical protein
MSGGRKSEKRVALAPDFGCGFVAAIPLRSPSGRMPGSCDSEGSGGLSLGAFIIIIRAADTTVASIAISTPHAVRHRSRGRFAARQRSSKLF